MVSQTAITMNATTIAYSTPTTAKTKPVASICASGRSFGVNRWTSSTTAPATTETGTTQSNPVQTTPTVNPTAGRDPGDDPSLSACAGWVFVDPGSAAAGCPRGAAGRLGQLGAGGATCDN